MKRILITGFEPFLEHETNPSQLIALHLERIFDQTAKANALSFKALILPVNTTGASFVASHILTAVPEWDAIIHLGLDASATLLYLELCAWNHISQKSTEKIQESRRGDAIPKKCINSDGSALLPTTINTSSVRINRVMVNNKIQWTRDPGTYYCNEQYYRSLSQIRLNNITPPQENSNLLPCCFIHVPLLSASNTIESLSEEVFKIAKSIVGQE